MPKPKQQPVVEEKQELIVDNRLASAVLIIEEKLSRAMNISRDELRKKSIVIKGCEVTITD